MRNENRLTQATAVACPALYAVAALRAARGGHPLWTPPESREPEFRESEVKGMGAPPRHSGDERVHGGNAKALHTLAPLW